MKSHCDAIFRNANPNYPAIVCRAFAHVQEFINCRSDLLGQRLVLNNFTSADGQFLFIHTCFNQSNKVSAFGFFITKPNYTVSIVGCCSQPFNNFPLNNLLALKIALHVALDNHITIQHIFNEDISTTRIITNPDPTLYWNYNNLIHNIQSLLNMHGQPKIHVILGSWMAPVSKVVVLGFNHSSLNLFLFGCNLLYWIMKSFNDFGYVFKILVFSQLFSLYLAYVFSLHFN